MDVEYVPTKHMSHYITLNKNTKSLEASVEFLPKMFAKLSSTVVQGNITSSNYKKKHEISGPKYFGKTRVENRAEKLINLY